VMGLDVVLQMIRRSRRVQVSMVPKSDARAAAAYRAQADALDIEAHAKRRLADEYEAAQARSPLAKTRRGHLTMFQAGKWSPH
jgi:hypothetical protein